MSNPQSEDDHPIVPPRLVFRDMLDGSFWTPTALHAANPLAGMVQCMMVAPGPRLREKNNVRVRTMAIKDIDSGPEHHIEVLNYLYDGSANCYVQVPVSSYHLKNIPPQVLQYMLRKGDRYTTRSSKIRILDGYTPGDQEIAISEKRGLFFWKTYSTPPASILTVGILEGK